MTQRRMKSAGLFAACAPVVAVLVLRFAVGGTPSSAGAWADLDEPVAPVAPARIPTMTDRQRAALAYANEAMGRPFGESPMHRARPDATPDAPKPAEPEAAPTPRFTVTSVMIGSRRAIATINGKTRRIGDEIEPGWRLTAIDGAQAVVVIESDDDRRIEVSIRQFIR